MAAAIKMDELLVSWLGNDTVYENVTSLIESYRAAEAAKQKENELKSPTSAGDSATAASTSTNLTTMEKSTTTTPTTASSSVGGGSSTTEADDISSTANTTTQHSTSSSVESTNSNSGGIIPPFYPLPSSSQFSKSITRRRRSILVPEYETGTWEPSTEVQQDSSKTSPESKQSPNNEIEHDESSQQSSSHPHDEDPAATEESRNDNNNNNNQNKNNNNNNNNDTTPCVRDQVLSIYEELGEGGVSSSGLSNSPVLGSALSGIDDEEDDDDDDELGGISSRQQLEGGGIVDEQSKYLSVDNFVRMTKEIFKFPSFFNRPLYHRIVQLWNQKNGIPTTLTGDKEEEDDDDQDEDNHNNTNNTNEEESDVITMEMIQWFWKQEVEPFDAHDRFFRLLKQPENEYIGRDDFLPYIKELLNEHPGLEFLSNHAEFQEKYAVTVITRIFYSVNRCHSGRITSRQLRRSDLLDSFKQVDEEEDINKVTRYFSYEHFYVLYCRFWELDTDRDYRITREDLLKYGDHSLSHMIVDRIFDAAPRPFECDSVAAEDGSKSIDRDYLSYEDFIFFMLSEEDKANEVSVRYWFSCVDVDGDGKLNNMEMRSFYAVQLHRMQCMGHEIVPFEDMLCQMMDMIKPSNPNYLIAEDFLQSECAQVSGALFDALFNLNKYLMFEQRDPFVERQKREDEFETDWDRFACIDYNRLAMEEEAREEEAMEIDWVTVDDEDEDSGEFSNSIGSGGGNGGGGGGGSGSGGVSEAPF